MLLLDTLKNWLGLSKPRIRRAAEDDLRDALFGSPELQEECKHQLAEMQARIEKESAERRKWLADMTKDDLMLLGVQMAVAFLAQFNRPASDLIDEIEKRVGTDPCMKEQNP